jgi:glycosyltransferase involved in cell wall biosynthesis
MAAVESVIVQTLPPLELIIVDDGSKASQETLLNGINAPFPIIFIRQENAGQSAAHNAGVKAANGVLPDNSAYLAGSAQYRRASPFKSDHL